MISLSTILPEHKKTLFDWRNDHGIYKWCRQSDFIQWGDHCNWFDNVFKNTSIKMYLIVNDNIPVGACGLTSIDLVSQRAEFSLYIGRDFQKRGYGKKALIKLLDHGFKHYPFRLIWGESFESNPAIRMFKELGFKIDGTRKEFYFKDGKNIDSYLLSIKRNDFYDLNITDCYNL